MSRILSYTESLEQAHKKHGSQSGAELPDKDEEERRTLYHAPQRRMDGQRHTHAKRTQPPGLRL